MFVPGLALGFAALYIVSSGFENPGMAVLMVGVIFAAGLFRWVRRGGGAAEGGTAGPSLWGGGSF